MPKREFESTKTHLRNTMEKQAGSIQKAYLESLMNSSDAGATTYNLNLHDGESHISDDGKGMLEEEIDTYFAQFGYDDEDQDQKTFGKFRMGRGQMFNFGVNVWHTNEHVLIVNIKEARTKLPNFFGATEDQDDVISADEDEVVLDSSGLGFHHFTADNKVDGCEVTIYHYNELEDVSETVSEFKRLARYIPFAHGIEVKINGEVLDPDFEASVETEAAWYYINPDDYSRSVDIYNQGAYVKDEVINCTSGVIITKDDLDVNFARNDIISGCPVYDEVVSEYNDLTKTELVESTDISDRQRKWLITESGNDPALLEEIRGKPLVSDVLGGQHSISELGGQKVAFANKRDASAQEAMKETGTLVIDKNFESVLVDAGFISSKEDMSSLLDDTMSYGGHRVAESDLSKRRSERLGNLRWVLRQLGATARGGHVSDAGIEVGVSKSDDVWRDGSGNIIVDRDALNCRKQEFGVELLHSFIMIAAADGDTRSGIESDINYRRRLAMYFERYPDFQNELL